MIITQRLMAVLVLVIPGAIATYGWTLIRDAGFAYFAESAEPYLWLKMVGGIILFLLGTLFIAGYYVHRDRKKKKSQPVILKKRKNG